MTRPARRSARGLLLDEMLSGTIAEQLPEHGLDVIAWSRTRRWCPGRMGICRPEAGQDRVLVTANIAAFAAIATDSRASGRTHPGWCSSHARSRRTGHSLARWSSRWPPALSPANCLTVDARDVAPSDRTPSRI